MLSSKGARFLRETHNANFRIWKAFEIKDKEMSSISVSAFIVLSKLTFICALISSS